MKKPRIYLSSPHIDGEEIINIHKAFEANWISSSGPFIQDFEQTLADYCGTAGAAVFTSGTAAIHLALQLLNVRQDDIVICQSFTFVGTSNPILYQKAIPIFVDSENSTWNMCPKSLEEAIIKLNSKGKIPKAIVVVHLYGMPAKMNEIMEVAKRYDISVIEDAAEALGSKINGKPCGSFGDFGILSFNGNKIITTACGGALLSNNIDALQKARFLASQAKDDSIHYQHSSLGYNYRMTNISAGIGLGQMKVLEKRIQARRENFKFYKDNLSLFKQIKFLNEPDGYYSNRWLSCVLITQHLSVKEIYLSFDKENIECRPLWKPMHLQPLYKSSSYFGKKNAETLFGTGICLPSGSNLDDSEKLRVVEVLKSIMKD